MKFDMQKKVYNLLSTAPSITAIVPATRIYPEDAENLALTPFIVYREIDQEVRDNDYMDDRAISAYSYFDIYCYVQNDGSSPAALALAVTAVMEADGWNLDASVVSPEAESRLRGRELRFSRLATAEYATI